MFRGAGAPRVGKVRAARAGWHHPLPQHQRLPLWQPLCRMATCSGEWGEVWVLLPVRCPKAALQRRGGTKFPKGSLAPLAWVRLSTLATQASSRKACGACSPSLKVVGAGRRKGPVGSPLQPVAGWLAWPPLAAVVVSVSWAAAALAS